MPDSDPTSNDPRPIWFPAKRYGWGWGLPIVWQGWVVLLGWMAMVMAGSAVLAGRHWVGFVVFLTLMCGLLIGVCYTRGERPRWRWGK